MTQTTELRFDGYIDAWEQCKLEQIADRFDNLRVPVAANLRIPGDTPYYGANGIQDYVSGFTHEGEFVLVAEDGANDLKNYPVQYVNGRIWVNNHAHVLQGKDKIASNLFLSYSIHRADIESLLVGGGRAKLNAETMMKIELLVPTLSEQEKIGECFSQLDSLITLEQKELTKLQQTKKALLEKMFPKPGADVPELRFEGFTNAWEQRKLGDMCDEFQSGKSIKASDITDSSEYAVYGGNGFRGYTDTYNHDGDYALIGRQGALCGNMNFFSGKAYFTEHAVAVHGNADNDTLFLYYLLDLMNLGRYSGQSAQPGLAVNKIIQLKTKAPKLDEQRLISSFFKQLDTLITLHQRKLAKLKQIKKAYLQKMFPKQIDEPVSE